MSARIYQFLIYKRKQDPSFSYSKPKARPIDFRRGQTYKFVLQSIAARYGDSPPTGGIIYNNPVFGMRFDSYGRGNCHNSVFQWMPVYKTNTNWKL